MVDALKSVDSPNSPSHACLGSEPRDEVGFPIHPILNSRGPRPISPRQPKPLVIRIGRPQREDAVLLPCRSQERRVVWVDARSQGGQDGRIISEVVANEDEHHQPRVDVPREFVVICNLIDLAGIFAPEGRGGNIQVGQTMGGQVFEPDVNFLSDQDVPRLYEGIADHGDVTAWWHVRGRGFTIEEPQAIGSRDRPEIEPVRPANFRVRFQDEARSWVKILGNDRGHERRRYPEPHFPDTCDHRQPDDEQHYIPADEARCGTDTERGADCVDSFPVGLSQSCSFGTSGTVSGRYLPNPSTVPVPFLGN